MARVLVIGAGLSGCTVAEKLACRGIDVILVEKESTIGGKVRSYGCKAVEKCQGCGVCLVGGLWDRVSGHRGVHIIKNAIVKDITGVYGEFTVTIKDANKEFDVHDIQAIVVSTGFDSQVSGISSHMHIEGAEGLITGTQLEELLLGRTGASLFRTAPSIEGAPNFEGAPGFEDVLGYENAPRSVAFIQCLGSRDSKEDSLYCSRVCCAYTTRSAKVIRSYYPECEIVFFYMELQNVQTGDFFAGLREQDMEFIKCRPLKIMGGKPVSVEYDDPAHGMAYREFDLVVLSNGIHAGGDNDRIAEVLGLGLDGDGFLKPPAAKSGIFVSGCARAPMKIGEAHADSVSVAASILLDIE